MNNRVFKVLVRMLCWNKGMSLVEVLVAIAMLGVIVVPLSGMFISSIRTDYEAEAKLKALTIAESCMEVQKKANTLPDSVTEEIIYDDGKFKAYRSISKDQTTKISRGAVLLPESALFTIELDSLGGMTVKDQSTATPDSLFDPDIENDRKLIISESGGYQYTDDTSTVIKSDSWLDIRNVVIYLNSTLNHYFNLEIDNKTSEIVDIYIYNDTGYVNVSGIDGDISVYENLTTDISDFDDLAVYDITIIVKNAVTNTEVERVQSKRMMYK